MKEGEPNNNNIERTSGLSELAGGSEEEKEQVHDMMADSFENQPLQEWEREKTPDEKEIIQGILLKLPDFVKRYGGKPLPLTEDHIHIVDEKRVTGDAQKQLDLAAAGYRFFDQGVIVGFESGPDAKNKLYLAQKVLHELLHFCAFQSCHINREKDMVAERRAGFSIRINGSTEFYFDKIDEALMQEALIMFDKEHFSEIPALSEELKDREELREKIKAEGVLPSELVAVAGQDGEPKAYAYVPEIYELRGLMYNIYLSNIGDVYSAEEVRDIFLRAAFTGRLTKVAKMVKRWGGKGAFRRLGAITKRDRGKKTVNLSEFKL